ncbi:MAG: PD-(D/E)XK nuclease family protein [Anaerolineae bacterium]|nr:PD-(D/E)XK nuclease family protein [Anaerolineae bacterium]
MSETLLLSRYKLTTFLACRRRFQLRYLAAAAWPAAPLAVADEARLGLGQQFHQLAQRHFLGLPVQATAIDDRTLRGWWLAFARFILPEMPHGRILPELTLTIPIGRHLLHGRFDLLIIGEQNGAPFARIFDWKTGRPPDETTLRHDWQTRLYLAMLAEGGQALWGEERSPLQLEQISITYWYAAAPEKPLTIPYTATWHTQNWAEIAAIVAQIEAQQMAGSIWPLTEDRTQCRVCAYQALCGRQEVGAPALSATEGAVPLLADEETEDLRALPLEPALP